MGTWSIMGAVAGAGALGGIVNAFISDNGFILPRLEQANGARVLRPGALGTILVGIVAALASWGLYGAHAGTSPAEFAASLAGALLVAVSGARWLTNEVDKRLLKATVDTLAAPQHPGAVDEAKVIKLRKGSPAESLRAARSIAGRS